MQTNTLDSHIVYGFAHLQIVHKLILITINVTGDEF